MGSINNRYRLHYHIMAPTGWLNDPNGLIQFKGQYHVFYQHYPYSADWGPMHWGHAVSEDLVHWKHLPVALAPDQAYEEGCFSGSAVDNHGVLTLIYTAHDENRNPKEQQCIAESTDGVHFVKYAGNPVIRQPPLEGSADFRDPKVWFEDGLWHMVLGTTKDGRAKAVLYQSDDLRAWQYVGVLFESDGTLGDMWECPDFFALGDKHVLVASPMNMEGGKNIYIIGEYDKTHHRFTPEKIQEVDRGHDFYAAQTFADIHGRRVLIAWMDRWGSPFPTQPDGWAGALTIPRELRLEEDGIRATPVKEMEKLRETKWIDASFRLDTSMRQILPGVEGDALELNIRIRFDDPACTRFGVQLRGAKDGGEKTLVCYDPVQELLTVDTQRAGKESNGIASGKLCKQEGRLDLHIFIDKCSVEVFAGQGRLVLTERIYPDEDSQYYDMFTENGGCFVEQVQAWRLQNIWETEL